MSLNLAQAKTLLEGIKNHPLTVDERIELSLRLAAFLQNAANEGETAEERAFLSEISLMVQDPKGKSLVTEIADQVFRAHSSRRAADQLLYLFKKSGPLTFLSPIQKLGVSLFEKCGKFFSFVSIPLVRHFIYKKTEKVIIPGEDLEKHLDVRRNEGIRLNLNHLGEAILGEDEAERRLNVYLKDLENPKIEYISVKISTLYSQIQLLDWDRTLQILGQRYKALLLASKKHYFVRENGEKVSKFVNLDMEEYKDLQLTIALFKMVLRECPDISAGIVLQSYLPDSFLYQQELTAFALERVSNGGAPIKIRIVKGANLAMEKVESSIKGWPLAPYSNKADVDANFKRMVEFGLRKEHADAVKIGVGSHNIFDIAYSWVLACSNGVTTSITVEMLEGMAEPSRRAIQKITKDLLLYCPVAMKEEFQSAVAYLIRRLDENTGPENFLRVAFDLNPGSSTWEHQAKLFSDSVKHANEVSSTPKRLQKSPLKSGFQNDPDTDWSLTSNLEWGKKLIEEWKNKSIPSIPLMIGGQEIHNEKGKGVDPSRPEYASYTYAMAEEKEILQCLEAATAALIQPVDLDKVADALRNGRQQLMGAMLRDVGKPLYESDAEVSEAIDFAVYYAKSMKELKSLSDVQFKPKGVVLVASPWNFPCSIPAGGILGALAAGNVVIFKPAPEAVLVGYELVKLFYEAGISKDLLHFLPCRDKFASLLVKDPKIDAVILTGGTKTAEHLYHLRPGLDLIAETGGKNSIIVTALADRDLAIRDIIQSAFGFSGQKCSACSVAILEAEVFDDPHFKDNLRDAAASLSVGSAYNPATKINPLIRPPEGALKEALLQETWLLEPRADPKNPHLISPGIQWGAQVGGFAHRNELFGPVLIVIRAKDLAHAIEIANDTPYGLTAGLHSLDEREHAFWKKHIKAGNCYINRGITGAIVERQPFGGTKKSSFGPSLKAGGPHYLLGLMHVEQKEGAQDSYAAFKPTDPQKLLGQSNVLSYVPYEKVTLRFLPGDSILDAKRVHAAASICNTPLKISVHPACADLFKDAPFSWIVETDENFISHIHNARIRLLSMPEKSIVKKLSDLGVWQMPKHVVSNGRIELLNYLREVSASYDYHRYGNLGLKTHE